MHGLMTDILSEVEAMCCPTERNLLAEYRVDPKITTNPYEQQAKKRVTSSVLTVIALGPMGSKKPKEMQ